jgi:hypothetical protein
MMWWLVLVVVVGFVGYWVWSARGILGGRSGQ